MRIRFPETPAVRNVPQADEKERKNSFLNYKSAALNQLSYAGLEVVAALRDDLLPGDALLVAHSPRA